MCAVICGADGWVGIENWGKAKQEWLESFLELPEGIPSHDTFGRVFAQIDMEGFQTCFVEWMKGVAQVSEGEIVAIDGKKLRRSHDKKVGKGAIHMVSAWATENHMVLGQRKVDEKSNEITAIPELLEVLVLSGCIVTIDAMGCQKDIAKKITDKGGDYVLNLKENQGNLYEDVDEVFDHAEEVNFEGVPHDYAQTFNQGHGRTEKRECWTFSVNDYNDYIRNMEAWAKFKTFAVVRRTRQEGDKEPTIETVFYISSLSSDAERLLDASRTHWQVENSLHWVLDVSFREDDCRVRVGNAPQNLALLRHIAVNLLKQEQSAKCGIKNKRLLAGWDHDYLLKVLSG
jgi:predicted transposase YbfD/YdcC